jgi:hypothetical protein
VKAESGDTTAWDQSCPKPKPPKPKVQSQNSAKNIKKQQKNKPTALELQTLELQTLELQTSELQTLEVR